jgi:hypothetical protein
MRKKLAALAGLAMAGLLAAPAVASATPTSGTVHVRITTTSDNGPGVIFLRGALNAGGTDYQGHNTDLAVFSDGAFSIHHPNGTFSFTLNPKTCVAKLSGTGAYTIDQGYGRYSGIKGNGTYKLTGTLTFAHKANGTCSRDETAQVNTVIASGPISF